MIPEPNDGFSRSLIYFSHQTDLLVPLLYIVLVDADGIDPNDSDFPLFSQSPKRSGKIRCDLKFATIDGNGDSDGQISPNV
jgi:hypothetical protein